MKLIIGGDIVPTQSNEGLFFQSNSELLVGTKLDNRLKNADYIALNLEAPLVDIETPIAKCGPCLIAPTKSITGLTELNPYFFTLANNHILDQGINGLKSTIYILNENKVDFAGAGMDLKRASSTFYKTIKGIRIGFFCCCEHEFSASKNGGPGANLFDPLYSLDQIEKSKEQCDYLIVLYHGGKEYYRYPSPYLQKVCRRIVDKGANLVVCQHTHCVGCKEEWKSGTIVYGQGNFLFDRVINDCWETGLLIELEFETKDKVPNINYIPLIKDAEKVCEAENQDGEQIVNSFFNRSEQIKDEEFIKREYKNLAQKMQWDYFVALSGKKGKSIFYRMINRLSGYRFVKFYIGRAYSLREKLVLQNYIECEAHRELLLEVLNEKGVDGIMRGTR